MSESKERKNTSYYGMTIFKNYESNPRRKGKKGWFAYELIENGMTYEDYIDAGGDSANLRWDWDRDYITLKRGNKVLMSPTPFVRVYRKFSGNPTGKRKAN